MSAQKKCACASQGVCVEHHDSGSTMTSVASEVEALKLQLKEKDRVIVRLKARLRQVGDAAHFLEEEGVFSPTVPLPQLEFSAFNSNTIDLFEAARRSVATGIKDPEGVSLSDIDSIRRRYVALDSHNPEGIAQLNPKTLFKPTFAVEYAEDSPSFRKKVEIMDESVEGLREHLTSLVSWMRKYCSACSAFANVGKELASKMMHLKPESWFTRMGDLAPFLVRFGEILDEVQSNNDALALSLETAFSAPMEDFVSREVKAVGKLRCEMAQALAEHESAIFKYLQLKRTAEEPVLQAKMEEMGVAKEHYELARFDMVNTLNSLEKKKKFQLVERLCSVFYSYLGYFHRCHMVCAAQEPFLRDLQRCVQQARKDFGREEKLVQAKRLQLQAEVHFRGKEPAHRLSGTAAALADQLRAALRASTPMRVRSRPQSTNADPFTPTSILRRVIMGLTNEHEEEDPDASSQSVPAGLRIRATRKKKTMTLKTEHGLKSNPESESQRPQCAPEIVVPEESSKFDFADATHDVTPIQVREESEVTKTAEDTGMGTGTGTTETIHRLDLTLRPTEDTIDDDRPHAGFEPTPDAASPPTVYEFSTDFIDDTVAVDGVGVVKQGFLWKRSTNMRKDWKRRWFMMRGGKLSYIRQEQQETIGPPIVVVSDILLCSVRECKRDADLRFCFEVISPNQRAYRLQAESDDDYQEWIQVIRAETERLLAGTQTPGFDMEGGGTSITMQRAAAQQMQRYFYLEEISKVNPMCADCGTINPEWVSVNLCVCVCIECSGVHRSLGVQVSKIRSLTLDKLPPQLLQLIAHTGNAKVNEIWEQNIPSGTLKPTPSSPSATKREWIANKYSAKKFLAPPANEDHDMALYQAAATGDLFQAMASLAAGADINFKNTKELSRTPLHAASIGGHVTMVEYLTQNGSALEAQDDTEHTPLDLAMVEIDSHTVSHDIIDVLVSKIEKELC